MENHLIEIDRCHWPALRDLYAPNSPQTIYGHILVETFLRWTDQQPDLPILTFYSLNGDWSDGTYAMIYTDLLFFFTLADTNERLRDLLELIDFSNGFQMHGVMGKDIATIHNVIRRKKLKYKFNFEMIFHHLPSANALAFDVSVPEGITLKSLDESHAQLANDLWPHRCERSLVHLQALAKFNPSVGAFDSDGLITAWIFRWFAGPLGVLQVRDGYCGRGLGKLVTKALCRKIAQLGQDITACVFEDNVHSLALFKKLGFTMVDTIGFMETLPTTEN